MPSTLKQLSFSEIDTLEIYLSKIFQASSGAIETSVFSASFLKASVTWKGTLATKESVCYIKFPGWSSPGKRVLITGMLLTTLLLQLLQAAWNAPTLKALPGL